jgi:hypothetical protein
MSRFRLAACTGAVLLLTAVLVGCDADSDGDVLEGTSTVGAGTMAIDRDAILNELDDVRAFLEDDVSSFAPEVITDVEFEGSELTVTVGPDIAGVEDAEAFCDDLAGAIEIADITITVVGEAGDQLAQCSFQG